MIDGLADARLGAMTRRAHDPPYAGIVLDCDSTLSTIEGIEELTSGHPEIAELTAAAMDGRVPLEKIYGRRLEICRPTRADVDRIGELYVETVVPGVREVVDALHHLGKRVAVVSGGLLAPVRRMARHLGIDEAMVHAVDVRFDGDGEYAGFDDASPLARRGGKRDVVAAAFPDGDVALVGDGATDLEAKVVCARFVAFTAVEERPDVARAADRIVGTLDFAALLPHLVSTDELERLARADGAPFAALLERCAESPA